MVDEKELDVIERANLAAQRLEHANAVNAELAKRLEAIEARRVLGGQALAGEQKPEVSPEQKLKEDTKLYFKGGVLEKVLK